MQSLDSIQDPSSGATPHPGVHPIATAPADSGPRLPARALEERRLIHRSESLRAHADAFRQLRTRLTGLMPGRNFVTLVAPVNPRCGGSFVARNLAAAFAFDEAKHALLVDCDARYPSQHTALRLDAATGLVNYLFDPATDIASLVYPTGVPRLDVVPFGRPMESASDAFTSTRMRTAIDSLRGATHNRYVVLDSPAVHGSPDARILSDLADLVVLVAGYGRTTREDVERAAASFETGKVAGVVFNNGV